MIFTQNYFHQKLNRTIFKRQISGDGDNLAVAEGIAEAVAVVVWRLRRGERNGENSGAATAIEPRWQIWSRGSGDGAAAEIFKRHIFGGGDNLAAAAGIAAEVVVVTWRLRRGGVGCGATGTMMRTAVRRRR